MKRSTGNNTKRTLGKQKLACLLLVVCCAGCGSQSASGILHGEVTLDGKPLEEGLIRFVPIDGQTPTADAVIASGRFTAHVPPGKKRVHISAPKVVGQHSMFDSPGSTTSEAVEELLPPRYNRQSELVLSIQPGEQRHVFDLQSQ